MTRKEIAILNHQKGYNCAQSVVCAFCDKLNISEDELFRLSEAFGFGMGCANVCGAVSAMVFIAGYVKSFGIDKLPETNKKESYALSKQMIEEFKNKNKSILCSDIKGCNLRSCDGCIEDCVEIIEKHLNWDD